MNNQSRTWLRFAGVFVLFSLPVFAAVTAETPEPSLVVLTAIGVGAVVLVARRKRGR